MADKVYLKSRFGYREDTQENWNRENPVLEKGEPAVVRDGAEGRWLKIGDGVTPFSSLPWKLGPKGEKGAQGEQGPQGLNGDKGDPGVSGVYVGSGEMPEGYNVQIDPNGSVYDLPVIDQAYSPESENPQSGKAVAEAVNKPWTLIEDITLTEAVNKIVISPDKLAVKELHIEVLIIPSDTSVTSQNISIGTGGSSIWQGLVSPKTTGKIYAIFALRITPNKKVICDGDISAYSYTSDQSFSSIGYYFMNDNMVCNYISDLFLTAQALNFSTNMASGTKFRVWGR